MTKIFCDKNLLFYSTVQHPVQQKYISADSVTPLLPG